MKHLGTEVTGDVLNRPLNELSDKALSKIASQMAKKGYFLKGNCEDLAENLNEWASTGAWRRLADDWPEFIANWVKAPPEVVDILADLEGLLKAGPDKIAAQIQAARDNPMGEVGAPEGTVNNPSGIGGKSGKAGDIDKGSNTTINNLQDRSKTYTLRRLARDHPDLLALVESGDLTPNAAAIQAGFRKRTITITPDVNGLLRAAQKHLSDDQIADLTDKLGDTNAI